MTTVAIASWLLTYLIHSTVLLGAVWLVSRSLGDRRLVLQETLLRTALVGGIITSSLQMCLGVEPLAGAFAVDALERPQAVMTVPTEVDGPSTTTHVFGAASRPGSAKAKSVADAGAGVLLIVWGAGSLLALLALGRSILDLKRLLQTRRFQPAGRLVQRLADAMGLGQRVRLSTSKAIAVPFATGVRKPEICCPDRVRDLATEHQTGLFAHELAHLARRDPAWQLLYRLGEAILFMQPLNRLVRCRLEEIAEHLTDERAVACTGDRLGLARCLVVIAHWGASSQLGIPATTLASSPRLGRRVRRLLKGRPAENNRPIWFVPMVVVILSAAALTLPLVASAPADAEVTATKIDPASAKTWSDAEDAPPRSPAPHDRPAPVAAPASGPPPVLPAPDTNPAPAGVESLPAPSAVSSNPAPASEPSPAAAPSPPSDAVPPAPSAVPAPPQKPEESNKTQDTGSSSERKREESRMEAEDRQRSAERERARAETRANERARRAEQHAQQTMRQAEERAREHKERTRQRAEEAKQRQQRLMEESREAFRHRADEMRALAEARAREMDRTSKERAQAAEERARQLAERAEEWAERAAVYREEIRRQAIEANSKAMEDARRLSEEARRLAEQAEQKALDEKSKEDK